MVLDRVRQVRRTGEQRIEQVTLDDRPDDLGRHDRGLGLDHRQLGDAVLAQDVDRLAHRLVRVGVHELRQVAGLAAQHVADRPLAGRSSRKP